jgi:hypothetical protein
VLQRTARLRRVPLMILQRTLAIFRLDRVLNAQFLQFLVQFPHSKRLVAAPRENLQIIRRLIRVASIRKVENDVVVSGERADGALAVFRVAPQQQRIFARVRADQRHDDGDEALLEGGRRVAGPPDGRRRGRGDDALGPPRIVDVEELDAAVLTGRDEVALLGVAPVDAVDAVEVRRDVLHGPRTLADVPDAEVWKKCQSKINVVITHMGHRAHRHRVPSQ